MIVQLNRYRRCMFFVSIKRQTSADHVDRQTTTRSSADNACTILFKM